MDLTEDIAGLYRHALDDDGLRTHLHVVTRRAGSVGVHLIAIDVRSGSAAPGLVSADPDIDREYREGHAATDPRVPRILAAPRGRILHQHDVLSGAERACAPVYTDFLRRHDGQTQLLRTLDLPGGRALVVSQARPGTEPYDRDDVRRFEVVSRHLTHVVALRQAEARRRAARGATGTDAFVLLAGTLRIVDADDGALCHLGPHAPLDATFGRLAARVPHEDRRLQACLRRALAGDVDAPRVLRLAGPGGVAPIIVTIALVPEPPFLTFGAPTARLVVVLRCADGPRLGPAAVAAALGLTAAEGAVAHAVARGLGVGGVAAERDVAPSTVRWTLRNIYGKLGIARQSGLSALVNRL